MIKFLHNLFVVALRPFAGPQQVNGGSGPWGEGHPGNYYGNGS